MKVATVYVEGDIWPDDWFWFEDEKGSSLGRLRTQVTAAGEFDKLKVIINSPGGCCEEGWAMYDYITTLGKPIETVVIGQCCSMATVLFMAGTERLISKHSTFMIHLPMGGTYGNMNEIAEYLEELKAESQKFVDFYTDKTGLSDIVVSEMLAAETTMTADEAIIHGFATGIYAPVVASLKAYQPSSVKPPLFVLRAQGRPGKKPAATSTTVPVKPAATAATTPNQMSKLRKAIVGGLTSLLALAEGTDLVALDVSLKNGDTLVTNSTGEAPAVGDTVTIGGETPADGEYETADGQIIVVTAGAISDIKAAETTTEETSTDPPVASAERIKQLEEEIAQLKAQRTKDDDFRRRVAIVLKDQLSAEPPIDHENELTTDKTTEERKKTAQDKEREDMLAKQAAKYQPKAKTAAAK
ncbi:Clp protease ClpP [Fibrisoma montanum]|uniref:ATP-dependent Clp protease proteolytic subunit n=1 Tax=Fibrisoma montanum TaxID=2305895 RepID=A0A418M2E0_9BACT|nr:Clp protease ClpP [Fibrisoma montanum]RIV19719.1 Clp protease ClpP [Fibrisoma montanum]